MMTLQRRRRYICEEESQTAAKEESLSGAWGGRITTRQCRRCLAPSDNNRACYAEHLLLGAIQSTMGRRTLWYLWLISTMSKVFELEEAIDIGAPTRSKSEGRI
jgi:hypothetical protein